MNGETGYVLRVVPRAHDAFYLLGLPSGEWEVPASDVESALGPFESLTSPAAGVYPYETWLKREASRLLAAYRNDPAGALSNSRIEPQPHQISVVMSCVEKPQPRMVLADEVGLGKTIEAGLVLKELRARGSLGRVLILTPAGLVSQWIYELRSKFNETFIPHDSGMLNYLKATHPDQNPWSVEPNVIASMPLARSDKHRDAVVNADWDLVIVDEAHHARNWWDNGKPRPNQAFDLLEDLHDKVPGLLLLTATPMQLHDFELFSMLSLVEPGLFHDYADFVGHRTDIAEINRHVAALRSGRLKTEMLESLATLLRRLKAPSDVRDVNLGQTGDRAHVADWLMRQHRLSDVLLRNRKAYVGGFVTREATRIPVKPTDAELELEDRTRQYIRRRYERALARGERTPAFALTTYEKMICSSSHALAAALNNRKRKLAGGEPDSSLTDDVELDEAARTASSVGPALDVEAEDIDGLIAAAYGLTDSKLIELERALVALFREHPDEKVLIFTQFIATLEMIGSRIAPQFRTAIFHGGMKLPEKDAAVRDFRERAQVLISSEAGGEGRNFQFCHIVVNYDLPWNPMKIGQRIGRVDRVGQKRNVLIYNFQVRGTLDERILDVLEHRVKVFTESVGALDAILGEVEARLDAICLQQVDDAEREIKRYELDLDTQLRAARRQEAQMRDLVMDSRSFRRDEVDRLLGRTPLATPEELCEFVRAALARYPTGGMTTSPSDNVLKVRLPEAFRRRFDRLEEEYVGSFDYRTALADERLEFFAFGHPLIEALIAETQREDFAPSPGAVLIDVGGDSAVLVDYELKFAGIREQSTALSHAAWDRRL